jgi:hypothetical protein
LYLSLFESTGGAIDVEVMVMGKERKFLLQVCRTFPNGSYSGVTSTVGIPLHLWEREREKREKEHQIPKKK